MNTEKSALERHAQTIVGALILAAVLWGGNTLQNVSVEVATLKVEITSLNTQIGLLQGLTSDRYTKQDATRDFRVRDAAMDELKARVRELEVDRK